MTFGVTPNGFELKTLQDILSEIQASELSNVDAALDLDPDQWLGQINAAVAQQDAIDWELLAYCYSQFDRGNADGVFLDNLGALVGVPRLKAFKGSVPLSCGLVSGTTLVAGSAIANVAGQPANRWTPKESFTAPSTGNFTVIFEATETGPITANAGTISVITTPVSGWNSVLNMADAAPGRNREEDADYRLRQQSELSAPGSTTYPAMRADVLAIEGVQQALVVENVEDYTDLDGLPPHSFEVTIFDGTVPEVADADIAKVIFDNKPSGIKSHGSIATNVVDDQGFTREVRFSRATQKPVYLSYGVQVDFDSYPVDGNDQVKAAVVAAGLDMQMGQDVTYTKFAALALGVPGVKDVTMFLGFTPMPMGTAKLPITRREIATFDSANIVVSATGFNDE